MNPFERVIQLLKAHPHAAVPLLGAAVGAPTGALFSEEGAEGRGAVRGALLGAGFGGAGAIGAHLGREAVNKVMPTTEKALLGGSLLGGVVGGMAGSASPSQYKVQKMLRDDDERRARRRMVEKYSSLMPELNKARVAKPKNLAERELPADQEPQSKNEVNDQTKRGSAMNGISLFKEAMGGKELFGGKMAPPFGKKKKDEPKVEEPKEKKAENVMDNAGKSATPGVLNARGSGLAPTDTASATESAIGSDKEQDKNKKRKDPTMENKVAEAAVVEADRIKAFEFGMDAFLKENGLTKEAVAEKAQVPADQLTSATIIWLSKQGQATQPNAQPQTAQ